MLFRFDEVSKAYGAQEILRAISFQVNPGEHIGLVGRNGAGKTTILRLISETESPDKGSIERIKGLRFGVLAQHVDFSGADTVLDAALLVFSELLTLEIQMRQLEHDMTEATGEKLDEVMHEYSDAQHAYEHAGGFSYHARAESVLLGLGFEKDEFAKKAENLSGGEKNRLGLARLLLAEPDILLLDEPTNHLDVEAVEWLEDFLSVYKTAYIVVSHDRFFLDHTVNRVIDLEQGRVDSYRGNYTAFLAEREERRELQQRTWEQQQELISRTEDFIRRNIAGQKTKQAKSRRKMPDRLDRVASVGQSESANFKLKPTTRTGDQVLILDDLAIGFPERQLAPDLSLVMRRGERLGVIGGNGTGKTTFLRTILGEHPALHGKTRWGSGVNVGYYDQRLQMVDDRHTAIEEIRTVAASTTGDGELRGFLGRFLFSGDDAFKSVASLSGGEKGRLALAKLIYSRANVLVLDEPTNHLDIASREALEDALNEYDGTIITVSHDRYFLDRIATQILYFSGSAVQHFDGAYTEFYESHHRSLAERQADETRSEKAAARGQQVPVPKKTPNSVPKKSSSNKKGKVKKTLPSEIEADIQVVETEIRNITEQLSSEPVAHDWERLQTLNEQYQRLDGRLKELYERWEAAHQTDGG
ncbi:MAG: ABC-F family ATP-binding cassette domain-containing protein [Acidobacteriota bacterium]